jgi:hypothetical protein
MRAISSQAFAACRPEGKSHPPLFDHFVCDGEQYRRHLDPEGAGRLHVDDKLEFVRLLYWEVGRFGPPENLRNIERTDQAPDRRALGGITHQTSINCERSMRIYRRDLVARR